MRNLVWAWIIVAFLSAAGCKAIGKFASKGCSDSVEGIEQGVVEIDMEVDPQLESLPVRVERIERSFSQGERAFKVYLVSDTAYTGSLRFVAKDGDERELGRVDLQVSEEAGFGKYFLIEFDSLANVGQAELMYVTRGT